MFPKLTDLVGLELSLGKWRLFGAEICMGIIYAVAVLGVMGAVFIFE